MAEELVINESLRISSDKLIVSAVRSSGPGGQNVNKVATCIELRFNPTEWGQLTHAALQRLLISAKKRLDAEGRIVITSQKHREQFKNLEDARSKLRDLILKCLKSPKVRRPTKPTKSSVENRIKNKKIISEKKQNRSKIIND
ncbi:MAG: alternative ribosome rescue aminoacyl-tRNA hydrolase ArfB [Candidatus Riflebacteria bacterium]|nr:alternative ribosome rescue aminoacyl-tRNA hydrolase ArfB [Candidatus Riflebacteria bacterium]